MVQLKQGCVGSCPGCSHRLLNEHESLMRKADWLKGMLGRWAGVLMPVQSPEGEDRWGYRGKVCLHGRYEDLKWQFGMVRRGTFIAIPECPVHAKSVRDAIAILAGVLPPADVFPLRYWVQSGQLLTLVVAGRDMPGRDWITEEITGRLKDAGLGGFFVHLNPSAGRRLFEKTPWIDIFGEKFARDGEGYLYGRTTFRQLIPALHHKSLDIAEQYLDPMPGDHVLDLYCGIGISMARWIMRGAEVLGVETGGEALACAAVNAPQAELLRGSCRSRIPQIREWLRAQRKKESKLLVYVNPPRTGIEQQVLDMLAGEAKPERLAYLSCSAGTMKRDLERLASHQYRVEALIPFDFFPQTHHVECLALVSARRGRA